PPGGLSELPVLEPVTGLPERVAVAVQLQQELGALGLERGDALVGHLQRLVQRALPGRLLHDGHPTSSRKAASESATYHCSRVCRKRTPGTVPSGASCSACRSQAGSASLSWRLHSTCNARSRRCRQTRVLVAM